MRILRRYSKEDFPAILSINDVCYQRDERPPADKLREMISISDVWQARDDDAVSNPRILGFAIVRPEADSAYLWSIAVDPEYQGRGVAGNILREVLRFYEDKKYRNVRLHVHVDNAAQKLYYDYGFRTYDLAYKYYSAGSGLGLMMKKEPL
jgi:ribosomal protein S18 acetylase RimI-like enzyme